MSDRWTKKEMIALAASGVAKVDLLGLVGTERCTRDEVAAMAGVIVATNALTEPQVQKVPDFVFRTRRTKA